MNIDDKLLSIAGLYPNSRIKIRWTKKEYEHVFNFAQINGFKVKFGKPFNYMGVRHYLSNADEITIKIIYD